MDKPITIQYIYNSSYTIDIQDYFIVIDYFRGDLVLPPNKQILFIVTHSHADHYSPEIFTYPGAEKALYLLSDDVEALETVDNVTVLSQSIKETETRKMAYDPERVKRVGPNERFEFAGIHFRSFGSTDRGISILMEIDGISIFHSGDLHAWKWPSSTEEVQEKEVKDFLTELDKIKNFPIDIGFGLVDPRLEENAFVGPDLYLEILKPQIFIPLHFRENFEITRAFADRHSDNPDSRVQAIRAEQDRIIIR